MIAGLTVSAAFTLPLATLIAVWWREPKESRQELAGLSEVPL